RSDRSRAPRRSGGRRTPGGATGLGPPGGAAARTPCGSPRREARGAGARAIHWRTAGTESSGKTAGRRFVFWQDCGRRVQLARHAGFESSGKAA
ncbi:unnamed protein product, partial [Staurois parvus]